MKYIFDAKTFLSILFYLGSNAFAVLNSQLTCNERLIISIGSSLITIFIILILSFIQHMQYQHLLDINELKLSQLEDSYKFFESKLDKINANVSSDLDINEIMKLIKTCNQINENFKTTKTQEHS